MAEVDYGKYDSSDFATISESINHSKVNPLLIDSLSDKLSIVFNNESYLVQEPSCTFKDQLKFFYEEHLNAQTLPLNEYYRPEITSKRLYNNANLWYILLLINDTFSINDWNMKTFKYIPASKLESIVKFINMAKQEVRNVEDYDISDMF